jgi:hypothetical protein
MLGFFIYRFRPLSLNMRILFALTILLAPCGVWAQADELLSLSTQFISYRGELSQYNNAGAGLAIGLKLNKNQRLNGHFQMGAGQFTASESPGMPVGDLSMPYNRFVRTTLISFHFEGNINIIKRDQWGIYLAPGFGILRFIPFDGDNNNLTPQGSTRRPAEIYSNTAVWLPIGIGGQFRLNEHIGFFLQTGFRNPQTDYLDNISEFGNPLQNDQLWYIQLGVLHKIKLRKERENTN